LHLPERRSSAELVLVLGDEFLNSRDDMKAGDELTDNLVPHRDLLDVMAVSNRSH